MAGSILKQTRNGKVSYRVRIDVPTPTGARQTRSRTVATRREADAILSAWRLEAATGGLTARSKQTVDEIAEEWLDLARPRLRPKTAADYERSVALIKVAFKAEQVQGITPIRVQRQYRAWAQAGVGARSIELAHLRLRQILDLAVKWKVIRDNPARAVDPPKAQRRARGVWTEEEARQFLQATADRRFHLLWSLLLATGLRRGEALGLRWVDLDLDADAPCVRVRQTVELVDGHVRIGEPKSDAAKRTIDIFDELLPSLIEERVRAHDRHRFDRVARDFDLVFCTHDGKPLWPDNVLRAFYQDIALAGVPRITLHDLRRTFATIASSKGVPIRELAAILGHAKPSVTMDIYAQGTRAGQRESVGRVGRALFG